MNKQVISTVALLLIALPGAAEESWVTRFTALHGKPSSSMARGLQALDNLGASLPADGGLLESLAVRAGVSPRATLVFSPVPIDPTALPRSRTYERFAAGAPTAAPNATRQSALRGCAEALVIDETKRTTEKPRAITPTFNTPFPGVIVEMRARLLDATGKIRNERRWKSQAVARTDAEMEAALARAVKSDAEREATALLKDQAIAPLRVAFRIEAPDGSADSLDWIQKAGGSVETPKDSEPGSFVAWLPDGLGAMLDAAAATGRYRLTSFNPVTLQRR